MKNNCFVYVVCGDKEHIDTLHYSLRFLKHFSSNKIIVLTDSSRNETPVIHDSIIDIKTPEKYNNHQASIFLKTGINQFLPKGTNYCYLDTDVLALSADCDAVFEEFIAPIRFAADHCTMDKFSAYAVNCDCLTDWKKDWDAYQSSFSKHDKNKLITDQDLLNHSRRLKTSFEQVKTNKRTHILKALRYILSWPIFKYSEDFFFNKKDRTWQLKTGEVILYETPYKQISSETGLKYSWLRQRWRKSTGEDLWKSSCNHLAKAIELDFQIQVKNTNWQHWNGGLFLFNDASEMFLSTWHSLTLQAFNLPNWKTRDQGTLIATVWQMGLENQPLLSKKWNFLADANNEHMSFEGKGKFNDGSSIRSFDVALIHIYHRFGDETWDLWRHVSTAYLTAANDK